MSQAFSISPELLGFMQDDPSFKAEICRLFKEDGGRLLEDLGGAIETVNNEKADEAAHALKGIFSNTGIKELWHLSAELNTLTRQEGLKKAQPKAVSLYEQLVKNFEAACCFVNTL